MEKEIKELDLLIATARTQIGLEQKIQGDKKDLDYPERRYRASKNVKNIENTLQMFLVLLETFHNDNTVTFNAMFNVTFGLLMCTLTFAEHIGHKFAEKYPYIFKAEYDEILKKKHEGLENDERRL